MGHMQTTHENITVALCHIRSWSKVVCTGWDIAQRDPHPEWRSEYYHNTDKSLL